MLFKDIIIGVIAREYPWNVYDIYIISLHSGLNTTNVYFAIKVSIGEQMNRKLMETNWTAAIIKKGKGEIVTS